MPSSSAPRPASGALGLERPVTDGYAPTDEEWAELVTVAEGLYADGYRWFSLGRKWTKGPDGAVKTLLNGSHVMGSQHLTRQPFGWFTLDELRREVFANGCR